MNRRLLVIALILALAVALTAWFATLPPPTPGRPALAYLAPSAGPYQVWMVQDTARPLTDAPDGVYDFAISRDGRSLVYSEVQANAPDSTELVLLDLQTNVTRRLTDCTTQNATCAHPVWRPDGTVIAYERTEAGDAMPRLWLLDLSTTPINNFPLFQESQIYGSDPQWSGDGGRLAFYDAATQSVLVYNFNATDERLRLQALRFSDGVTGALSPDGARLVYPELIVDTPVRAEFRIADLLTGAFADLTPDDIPTSDRAVAWHPDGERVVISRRYLDENYTAGDQLYSVMLATGAAERLIYDPAYQHSSPTWSADGRYLALHRYALADGSNDTTPEIWVYEAATKALTRVATDSFEPQWVENK
ncbi:MAG: PD40 domain-containing protein [Armatimonadetes bacterium]|nr:PD40 domain-containing protein [Anaerolineae bacterium]